MSVHNKAPLWPQQDAQLSGISSFTVTENLVEIYLPAAEFCFRLRACHSDRYEWDGKTAQL